MNLGVLAAFMAALAGSVAADADAAIAQISLLMQGQFTQALLEIRSAGATEQ